MKKLLLFFLVCLATNLHAGFYVAGHGGTTRVLGGDEGIRNNLKGNTYGGTFGYQLPLVLAVEGSYRHMTSKGTVTFNHGNTPTDVNMGIDVLTAGARIRFLWIMNVFGGYANYNYKSTATQNGQDISTWPLNGTKSGYYLGGGLKIPLPKIDIFSDAIFLLNGPTGHMNLEFGVRYFF